MKTIRVIFDDVNVKHLVCVTVLSTLPGIENHHCSLGHPGGFVIRLEEGTYFGHIVEHVALELTDLTGIGRALDELAAQPVVSLPPVTKRISTPPSHVVRTPRLIPGMQNVL